jgi:membrane-bound lytic murein transglycosylase D
MKKLFLLPSCLFLFASGQAVGGVNTDDENAQLAIAPDAVKIEVPQIKTGAFWQPGDFSKQESSVGWSQTAFSTPPGFEARKNFWIDIYTKYSTHQAVIHDAQYLEIIYKVVDFSIIDQNATLTNHEKEKARRGLIKEEKHVIQSMLLHIQALEETPSRLSPDELKIFQKFRYVYGKKRFVTAADRHHLRMQLGQRDRFMLGVYYSGRYIREIESIFRNEGVPVELSRLPFVESSFNINARSRVGASGIWQFMRSTGRLYLKSDRFTDLRNDPIHASKAAAKLLRANFRLLGSWPLALTAYNHGPGGVAQIVKKMRTSDINEIVWNTTRRRFGFASENFYAEFLAALEVESNCEKYFGKLEVSPPLTYEEIELPIAIKYSKLTQVLGENVQILDPFFTPEVIDGLRIIPKGFLIRIPKDQKEKFISDLSKT